MANSKPEQACLFQHLFVEASRTRTQSSAMVQVHDVGTPHEGVCVNTVLSVAKGGRVRLQIGTAIYPSHTIHTDGRTEGYKCDEG